MPVPLRFNSSADAWLETYPEFSSGLIEWCFGLAASEETPGRLVPGFQPSAREAIAPLNLESRALVTYVRYPNSISIVRIELAPDISK